MVTLEDALDLKEFLLHLNSVWQQLLKEFLIDGVLIEIFVARPSVEVVGHPCQGIVRPLLNSIC